jgi:hypothetical protein
MMRYRIEWRTTLLAASGEIEEAHSRSIALSFDAPISSGRTTKIVIDAEVSIVANQRNESWHEQSEWPVRIEPEGEGELNAVRIGAFEGDPSAIRNAWDRYLRDRGATDYAAQELLAGFSPSLLFDVDDPTRVATDTGYATPFMIRETEIPEALLERGP